METDAPKATDIRALRWIAPGADRVKALTEKPVTCIKDYPVAVTTMDGKDVISPVEIGRIAFESPALLGGAAGRMGLSCASCHLNGRGNVVFQLEGVSGEPGTADITGNFLSKVRGDAVFNPVPIPDLAARDGRQIADRTADEFRSKLHGLIVEEFDGQEPPEAVFEAVRAYLDALDIGRCADPSAYARVRSSDDVNTAGVALGAAGNFAEAGDKGSALLMARASREALERAHERFIARDQAGVRAALIDASRVVETWAATVRSGQASDITPVKRKLSLASDRMLEAGASLYNPDVLRDALASEHGAGGQ